MGNTYYTLDFIRIPDLTGKLADDAKTEMERLGLKVELQYVIDSSVGTGCVSAQNWGEGTIFEKSEAGNETMILYINKGEGG